ncbi:ferric reductase-like transmembrane domain-containing protein [Clostridium manihotivorum]|uniref:Ferric reductase n=1 Tax=Clostridium manihotivorum TaxID=2320868 RepID=A0A3R5V627_9CLOT|nr:ferric reductase-like transmembrane domain-containing protein [Clostridium manihotivorum]QAA31015.1 ferric reductase [Clostridium manihotivorum]
MIFIYSLIAVIVFTLIFAEPIRKKPIVFYCIATLISLVTGGFELYKLSIKINLSGFINQLEKAASQGFIALAFFVLVMYAGALSTKWSVTKKLMSIRGPLAIIGSILILSHVITYLTRFVVLKLPKLISGEGLPVIYLVYITIGFIAFAIMLPLFVTSFRKIRKNIRPLLWKRLHRCAYVFYILIYLHVILRLMNGKKLDVFKVACYTIVFGLYLILKLVKVFKSKKR